MSVPAHPSPCTTCRNQSTSRLQNGRNLNGGGGHGYAGGSSGGVVFMATSASATCHGGGGSGGGWWANYSRAIGTVSSTFSDWSSLIYNRMVVANGYVRTETGLADSAAAATSSFRSARLRQLRSKARSPWPLLRSLSCESAGLLFARSLTLATACAPATRSAGELDVCGCNCRCFAERHRVQLGKRQLQRFCLGIGIAHCIGNW